MTFEVSLPARGTTVELDFATTVPSEPGALLVPVATGDGLEIPVTALGAQGLLKALQAVGASGKAGEVTRTLVDGNLTIAFGLGDSEEIAPETVRRGAGAVARQLHGIPNATITTELGIAPIVEGLLLGGYSFTGLKSVADSTEPREAVHITVVCADSAEAREEFERAVIIAESTLLTRDLVNTPSNLLDPETYAAVMEEVAMQTGLQVEVYDEKYLEANGFGGIIAVGKGSARPPRLVHLVWHGGEGASSRAIALVGKGITFDTGGISLKPASNMEEMISDMGGSAAQLGAIAAAARLKLPVRVEAWLPLAENMPSGSASRPGDVITHYGGITSEVLNTDAEGRLVLADALARASEDEPDYIIEVATLTGAQMVALGKRTTAVMGSEEFRDRVAALGRRVGENAWAMPLLEEQEAELTSPVADVRNVHNSRNGGMLYAGLYLSRFVHENSQWVHMDIAGPSWNSGSPHGYTPKRATGAAVRTIVETLRELSTAQS